MQTGLDTGAAQPEVEQLLTVIRLRMNVLNLQAEKVGLMLPRVEGVGDIRPVLQELLSMAGEVREVVARWNQLDAHMTTEGATPPQWRGLVTAPPDRPNRSH